MNHQLGDYLLRCPEPSDLDAFYVQKNDPEIAGALGGFSMGYARADLNDWLEFHRKQRNEVLWAIAEVQTNRCVGHVGLYQIDHRVRMAEFAIMIGDKNLWGQGLGSSCTKFVLGYGFAELNLNRIHLSALAINARAINLYRRLGFQEEGRLRQAQYKSGQYLDVLLMGLLREEFTDAPT